MKGLSIRIKITLWFTLILAVIVALTYIVILSVSNTVIQKTIRDNLVYTVTDNLDEIEFYSTLGQENYDRADLYMEYNGGYLEVDDDYLDIVNGVSTSLYLDTGELVYGENPIAKETAKYGFVNNEIRNVSINGTVYYIYDSMLLEYGLDNLWLRGVVAETQGEAQLANIARISLYILPLLLVLAAFGGYFIAGRVLNPITKIESAALQIGRGQDLKKRIELSPGNDELHRLAATFNEMFERLDVSFESERQFTSDVSHELRTPVSVIMAQCEYSLECAKTSEDYNAALQTIQRQGKKMSGLIEDMLAFVRLEQKADNYPVEPLDFSELVTSVCTDMALLKEQGITLTFEVESDIVVTGNRALLSRLLTNLISNAYRYGRQHGSIKVSLVSNDADIILSVCDDGIGIAKEQQEAIFNRFYQVDASRTGKGTGLGLSMVKEIARFHGGDVRVESELGKGSKFEFVMKK